MEDVSILARIRAARLQPKSFMAPNDTPIYIKKYDRSVTIYFHDDLILNYRYVAVSVLDDSLYLEFSNVKNGNLYSITKRGNRGQTAIGGSNKKILESYVGFYDYKVVSVRKTTSLIVKLKRKEV